MISEVQTPENHNCPSFGRTFLTRVSSFVFWVETKLRDMTLYVVLFAIEGGAFKSDKIIDLFRSPISFPGFVSIPSPI